MQGGGCELRRVELTQQGLQRNDFSRSDPAREDRTQFFTNGFVPVAGAALRSVKIEWRQSATRQLAQPRDLARRGESNDVHWLGDGDTLQLRRRHRRLVEDDRMNSGVADVATSDVDGFVVLMIAEGAQDLCRLARRGGIAGDDHC